MAKKISNSEFLKWCWALMLALILFFAMLYIRDLFYNDIRLLQISDDSIESIVLNVSTGKVLPIQISDGRGSASFTVKEDAVLSLSFLRNGRMERSAEFGYVTSPLGADYDVVIDDSGIRATYAK